MSRQALCLAAVLLAGAWSPLAGHVADLTREEMIGLASHIVVARVIERETRWNEQRTLIVTEYTLAVEKSLKGGPPTLSHIVIPGGTLDGETHDTCLSVELTPEARYLLFLEDLERPSMTPLLGAWQGVFREIPNKVGRPGVGVGPQAEPVLTQDGRQIAFEDFVNAMAEVVRSVGPLRKGVTGQPLDQGLPAKLYDPMAPPDSFTREPQPAPAGGPPPPADRAVFLAEPFLSPNRTLTPGQKYVYQNRPPAPIVVSQLPRGSSFSPVDENQLAFWNKYGKNLFRVYANPPNTWAFGNGIFDIAGFPSNSTMIQQFGQGWGSDTLGVTWTRVSGSRIIEADIAFNPAFSWTTDQSLGTHRTNSLQSFNQTMLHEAGHAWGLKHPWATQNVWWDSVMNYAPKSYRVAVLFTDDTNAVRKAYPGLKLRDALISSYSTADGPFDSHAVYTPAVPSPRSVSPGGSFSILNPIKIENAGVGNIVNPSFEVYLTPRRFSWDRAIFLGTVRTNVTIKPFFTQRFSISSLPWTVPRGTPPGTYFLGFFIRDPKDRAQENNSSWSNSDVTVVVSP